PRIAVSAAVAAPLELLEPPRTVLGDVGRGRTRVASDPPAGPVRSAGTREGRCRRGAGIRRTRFVAFARNLSLTVDVPYAVTGRCRSPRRECLDVVGNI